MSAADVIEVIEAASEVFTTDGVVAWMAGANKMLGGLSPLELIDEGRKGEVLDLIELLASGSYA